MRSTRAKCRDCPFHERGPGRDLRRTLRPGRWRGILLALRLSQPFYCHHTTIGRPRDRWEFCRGAMEYQRRFNASPGAAERVAKTLGRMLDAERRRRPRRKA